MARNINSYYRNQNYRPPLPRPFPMSRYVNEEPIPMSEINHPEPGPSQHSHYDHASGDSPRPTMVVSGHRKFNTIYAGPQDNFDNHADKIVAKMEQHRALMEDTPISEQLRKEALRELPQCLTMKRCVKKKLSKSISRKSQRNPIGFWKRLKYRLSIKVAKTRHNFKHFNYFELWHGTLKDIEGHFGSGYASYFKFLRWLFVMNLLVSLMAFSLITVPQIIYDSSGTNGTVRNTRHFQLQNIFIGDGFFKETVLYYGHYTHNTIALVPYLSFYMPAAYFSVTVILYLLSFFILGVSVAQSYRRSFIETEGGLQNIYANKVFCGWDYAIATEEAAELKSSAIYHELKELLSESYETEWDRSCLYKFWTCTIQAVVNILILVVLVGVAWACWSLLEQFSFEGDGSVLVTTVAVNIIMMVFPIIFNYISKYEDYNNPRTILYITLTRTYLLGAVIIGTIVGFWLNKADVSDCWEDRLGAEIYRLIVFDFIFSVVLSSLIEISYLLVEKCRGKHPESEFDISKHTLQIIYNQALFWVGFLYSPILPALVTVKMFIIWYIREGCVRNFCKPPRRTWRAAQTQTFFMMLIFVTLVLIVAGHGYTLKSISPSDCGTFRNYERMYQMVTRGVANLEDDHLVWKIVIYITKPGAIALIMIGLCVLVYYFKEQAFAQKEKVKMLRDMLVWMSKDKKFLNQMYTKVTRGDVIGVRDNRFMDPSHILPYEVHGYSTEDVDSNRSSSINGDDFSTRFKKYS